MHKLKKHLNWECGLVAAIAFMLLSTCCLSVGLMVANQPRPISEGETRPTLTPGEKIYRVTGISRSHPDDLIFGFCGVDESADDDKKLEAGLFIGLENEEFRLNQFFEVQTGDVLHLGNYQVRVVRLEKARDYYRSEIILAVMKE